MFKRIRLAHKITRFYHIFGEVLNEPAIRTKLRDLKSYEFLLSVQYDLCLALEGYDDDETDPMQEWLSELYNTINDAKEAIINVQEL